MTEGEMVGWHHRLKGHEFDQVLKMVKVALKLTDACSLEEKL